MQAEEARTLREASDPLPNGWVVAPLPDVAEINPAKPRSDAAPPDTPVSFVPMPAVDDRSGAITMPQIRPFALVRKGYTAFRDGDVIMAKITPCMENGKAAIARGLMNGLGFGSTEFHVLRSRGAVLPDFLYHFIRQESFRREAEAEMTGSVGQKRVPREFLEATELPVPPLTEQRRIVEMLDILLGRLSSCHDRLERVPAILSRFRQAVLAAACSGRLTEEWRGANPSVPGLAELAGKTESREQKVRRGVPEDVEIPDEIAAISLPPKWKVMSCANLLRSGALIDVKDGNHGANHPKASEFSDIGVPFITAAQVTDAGVDYEGAPKVSGAVLGRLKVGFAEVDDVILTHKGSVGRVAMNKRRCVLTPQTTYYRCRSDSLDPGYLAHFLRSLHFYRQLAAVMSQTTRDFVPISEQYKLFMFVPPLEEQHEIGRRINALLALSDRTAGRFRECLARTEQIQQSTLAKAFRGELVPTEAELAAEEGREYETAEELLARIQQEKGKNSEPGKASRRIGGRGRRVA